MTTHVKNTVEVTLTLNAKDALILKLLMQNPSTEKEDEMLTDFRGRLFAALPSFQELGHA